MYNKSSLTFRSALPAGLRAPRGGCKAGRLGVAMLQMLRGNYTFAEFLLNFFASVIVIFVAMPVHEWAHAFVAVKLGDPTPKYQGRLRFSPFAHIDYIGALMILLFGFGYAKPVPVNSSNFKKPKSDMALVALAGPLSNLIMGFVLFAVAKVLPVSSTFLAYVQFFLSAVVSINVSLAVFNLIPLPPLDGSRLISALLPNRVYYRLMQYEQLFMVAVMALAFTGALSTPLYYAQMGVYRLFNLLTFFL